MYACNVNALPAIESKQCLYSTKQKKKAPFGTILLPFIKMDQETGFMSKNRRVGFIMHALS